jgi:hypothetical protein
MYLLISSNVLLRLSSSLNHILDSPTSAATVTGLMQEFGVWSGYVTVFPNELTSRQKRKEGRGAHTH